MKFPNFILLTFIRSFDGKRATSYGQMEKLLRVEDVFIQKLMSLTDQIAKDRREISILRDKLKDFQVKV